MNKDTIKKLLIVLLICLMSLGSCSDSSSSGGDSSSSGGDSTSSNTDETTQLHSIIIYKFGTTILGNEVDLHTCYGTDSNGWTHAPFYSTSSHDLKDRLPEEYWGGTVYSLQKWKIADSWTDLWDGSIDSSLFATEVIDYDDSPIIAPRGWWSGTKADGKYSGSNCQDWVTNNNSENATIGFVEKTDSEWVRGMDNVTCYQYRALLCFMYK